MLIDTHAHLQWGSFDRDRVEVIRRAKNVDVQYIVNIGFDLNGSRKGIELSKKYAELFATVGIHPHNASQFNQGLLHTLRDLAKDPKVVAIGEIGLDYYRNLSRRETQRKAFEAQLLLAEDLELPVVIHDREAHADILKVLSQFKGRINGVMHCFSGSKTMAKRCIELEFNISFAGPVTFPKAHTLQEVATEIDMNRILLETDSPWLAPQVRRGKRNEPAFLPFIAETIAKLRGISFEELAEVTTKNAKRVFRLP